MTVAALMGVVFLSTCCLLMFSMLSMELTMMRFGTMRKKKTEDAEERIDNEFETESEAKDDNSDDVNDQH